jgi:hypothetical protein
VNPGVISLMTSNNVIAFGPVTYVPATVPEPSAWILFLTVMLAVAIVKRSRRTDGLNDPAPRMKSLTSPTLLSTHRFQSRTALPLRCRIRPHTERTDTDGKAPRLVMDWPLRIAGSGLRNDLRGFVDFILQSVCVGIHHIG